MNLFMKKGNKILTIFLVSVILVVSVFAFRVFVLRVGRGEVEKVGYGDLRDSISQDVTEEVEVESNVLDNETVLEVPPVDDEVKIPSKVLLDVTFLSQAPFGVWDAYHEEACEESSLIMMEYYLSKKTLNNSIGEDQIQKLIKFQIDNYGDYEDTSVQETVEIAREFYGRENLRIVYDFEKEDIKKELAKGNPVIVPAAGRLLGNPNFTPPGPLYHNIILIGYEGNTIISNDPGTRKGAGYKYDIDVLYDAIHDFPGDKNKVLNGRKAMIVVR